MSTHHTCSPTCAPYARHSSTYVLRHDLSMGMACDCVCAEIERELAQRPADEQHRPCKRCRTGVGPTVDFCYNCSGLRSQPRKWTGWSRAAQALWNDNVAPLFKEGEWCSEAWHFMPRPRVDEYNRGSRHEGFIYTVQPGNRVALWQRLREYSPDQEKA